MTVQETLTLYVLNVLTWKNIILNTSVLGHLSVIHRQYTDSSSSGSGDYLAGFPAGVPSMPRGRPAEIYMIYRKTSSISRTKSQNLNVSHLVLPLSLPNPLKPSLWTIPAHDLRIIIIYYDSNGNHLWCPMTGNLWVHRNILDSTRELLLSYLQYYMPNRSCLSQSHLYHSFW